MEVAAKKEKVNNQWEMAVLADEGNHIILGFPGHVT